MPSNYFVAWWNVENLFDDEGSPRRTDKLRRTLGRDLDGWTPQLRDRKIDQLVSAIAQFNNGNGPDLMGVCEVENEFVVERLRDRLAAAVGRAYAVVHADTRDQRGIDVAFIFDPNLFTAPADQRFQHVVVRRTATREIFQVNFETHRGRTWTVFGNHWPSRSGGPPIESAGYRAIAGETLAYFHQRALEVHGKETPVLVMGDFNDEPFNDSLMRYALSTRQRAKVLNGTSPRLWNLMWDLTGETEGTYYFDNFPNMLDQFLVNKNMVKQTSSIRALPESVEIIRLAGMVGSGDYPKPVKFGGMGKDVDEDGFSDHYPIALRVREAD